MTSDGPENGYSEDVMADLKDFQRDAVEYVFQRFYKDEDATRRFLVASETGLGKTLVARGVVARTVAERVRLLEERYAEPLPELAAEVESLGERVEERLRQMGVDWIARV